MISNREIAVEKRTPTKICRLSFILFLLLHFYFYLLLFNVLYFTLKYFCGYFRIPKPKRKCCLCGELYFTNFYKNISWWGFVYIAFKLFHLIYLVLPFCECEKCESKSLANMDDMFSLFFVLISICKSFKRFDLQFVPMEVLIWASQIFRLDNI